MLNGKLKKYSSDDILEGDLILVMIVHTVISVTNHVPQTNCNNYGDIFPADLLLVEGNRIKMDERSLAWEAYSVIKEIFHKCEKLKK